MFDIALRPRKRTYIAIAVVLVLLVLTSAISVAAGAKNQVLGLNNATVSGNATKNGANVNFNQATTAPTQPTTTQPAATTTMPMNHGLDSVDQAAASLRNTNPKFSENSNVPMSQLNLASLVTQGGSPSDGNGSEGQFRTYCQWSHFNNDDPIVYPGKQNATHLHMYFGNTMANYATNDNSLFNSGGGSCLGYAANRTAYWVPAMKTTTGKVVLPRTIIIYYKTGGMLPTSSFSEMPKGLKILTGFATATEADPQIGGFKCSAFENIDVGDGKPYIPDCPVGSTLREKINFPNCWNGVLDPSKTNPSDNRSNMAFMYATGGSNNQYLCPASHPIRLPRIQYLVDYAVTSDTKTWFLSSDRMNGVNKKPGTTLHADWYGGWADSVMTTWTNNCIKTGRNCSPGILNNGTTLAGGQNVSNYPGPYEK